jgi:hypothetical protein
VWVYHGDPIRGDRLVERAPSGWMRGSVIGRRVSYDWG